MNGEDSKCKQHTQSEMATLENEMANNQPATETENNNHSKIGLSDSERDTEGESESTYLKALALETKSKKGMKLKDGKTIHPKITTLSRETRELAKKHLQLEKNLKIDGIPAPTTKMRKRRMSVGSSLVREREVAFKRKRLISLDSRPKKDHMPKWAMLGGDATDPLNLNGLATSEEGRILNSNTPKNSPLPTPDFRKIVYVKIPPNIEDPLNLEGKHDQKYMDKLLNSKFKKRHRAKKHKEGVIEGHQEKNEAQEEEKKPAVQEETKVEEVEKPPVVETASTSTSNPEEVVPQPRSLSMSPERKLKRQISGSKNVKPEVQQPKKFPQKPKFTQGNYNRYYGYRNQDHEPDPRLRYFNPSWFENKDILDIGCNVGHLTLALAQQFCPRKILGMDVDGKLIGAARQNIRHMLSQKRKDSSKFPSSFELSRGPLEAHPIMSTSDSFPNNVLFLRGNYVPGSEEILAMQKEEYDTILALSITKWIHLNNGDHGLKLFFRKIHRQLRPGGRLILEPQPWATYKKRAKMTPELFNNYASIKFKPEGFKNYLLSIGFVKCEVIGVPITKAKGFRRPLILFTKSDPHSKSLGQNPSSSSGIGRFCTECAGGDPSMCDHIQFVGLRQGAYADRLYDRVPFRSADSGRYLPYPSPHAMEHAFGVHGPMSFRSSQYSSAGGSSRSGGTYSKESEERSRTSSLGGGSVSERSWTSESSHSSMSASSSSYSNSSSVGCANGLNNGPVNGNGHDNDSLPEMNGEEVAADIEWVQNENANQIEDFDEPVPQLDPLNSSNSEEWENAGGGELVNGYICSDEG